jgi:hypothetical protein
MSDHPDCGAMTQKWLNAELGVFLDLIREETARSGVS